MGTSIQSYKSWQMDGHGRAQSSNFFEQRKQKLTMPVRGSVSNLEGFFEVQCASRRPTLQTSMIAKRLQIENATLRNFVSFETLSHQIKQERDRKPHRHEEPIEFDLESQMELLGAGSRQSWQMQHQVRERSEVVSPEQRRHLIKGQLLKLGYAFDLVEAVLFKSEGWQTYTSLEEVLEALEDPMKHEYVADANAAVCLVCSGPE